MRLRFAFVFLCAVLWAEKGPARPRRHGLVPLEQVIAMALEKRPGKFLEAELEETRGVLVYEIEILGRDHVIYKLTFDAHTGRFLGEEED